MQIIVVKRRGVRVTPAQASLSKCKRRGDLGSSSAIAQGRRSWIDGPRLLRPVGRLTAAKSVAWKRVHPGIATDLRVSLKTFSVLVTMAQRCDMAALSGRSFEAKRF